MATRAGRFAAHLQYVTGEATPEVYVAESTKPGLPQVTALCYRDLPEDGMVTAVTYGVSLATHPDWRNGGAELCLCVRSTDAGWPRALGAIGEQLRGVCPFAYGNTIDFGEPIAADTAMTAFFVFASSVVDREDAIGIDVGEPDGGPPGDLITIQGVYPIHDSERRFIDERGLEAFWHAEWDTYDVTRPPAV